MKVLTTTELKRLNADAIRRGYNRALSDETINKLDPDGKHVLDLFLWHNESEFRCRLAMKFVDDDEPNFAYLDVAPEEYEKLKTVDKPAE